MTHEEKWLLKEKYQDVESNLSAAQAEAFHVDCARLESGEPLAYVIGYIPFLDCKIYLNFHPLIPRSETEFWVEKAISEIKSSVIANGARQSTINNANVGVDCQPAQACFVPRNDYEKNEHNLRGETPKIQTYQDSAYVKVLDLCAGSGAIGAAVAKAVPETEVTFAEIDPALLPTIEKNFFTNIAINRDIGEACYKILQSDLFENISEKFDFILSNPPYIDADAGTVETSVAEHEPHLALFGGRLGLELISRIIVEAPTHLSTTGQLWLEHDPKQVEAITALAKQNGLTITTHHDQYKIPRFSVLAMAQ